MTGLIMLQHIWSYSERKSAAVCSRCEKILPEEWAYLAIDPYFTEVRNHLFENMSSVCPGNEVRKCVRV